MNLLRDLYISRGPAAGFAAVGVFWGSFAALVPVIKPQVGLSDGQFGLALLITSIGAVMAMWLAPLAERGLGARALGVLTALLAVATLLPGHTTNGVMFTLAMLGVTMTSGTLDVAMNARVSALEAQVGRSLMNLNHAVFSVAYAFCALATGLARELGLGPAAILTGGGLLIGVLMLQAFAAPVPDAEHEADGVEVAPLPWALLLPGGMIILIAFMSEQATEGWSALHLERNLGAGAAQGALGPALLGITMAVGRLTGQVVANRVSERMVIRWASVTAGIGACIAATAPSLGVAYLGFSILGLGVSVMAPMAYAWIGRMVPNRYRSHAISRISVVGYAGFFVGPPLMGFLSEGFGLAVSFLAIGGILFAVPLLLVPVLSRRTAP
ncbi:MFS transporter [Marivita cryptomonadis]|uniref:MFS transporter n=2 Tax=Roseobacteraceae TaxID=2854170 RepID=A0A9Q2S4F9_9RHOB|nr:MFS transporter [Marivita cryptomonadis]MBM2330734.1 MFS transporter [Marivita cryptomonadis]MBM2340320.1 MFS transporter [Marivita cryptomonadis]MBM2344982.1 MFS transporter [Marivita cryptomonadis]MBM2349660.1 MFS transporter [Marivita cryptomonadis]